MHTLDRNRVFWLLVPTWGPKSYMGSGRRTLLAVKWCQESAPTTARTVRMHTCDQVGSWVPRPMNLHSHSMASNVDVDGVEREPRSRGDGWEEERTVGSKPPERKRTPQVLGRGNQTCTRDLRPASRINSPRFSDTPRTTGIKTNGVQRRGFDWLFSLCRCRRR